MLTYATKRLAPLQRAFQSASRSARWAHRMLRNALVRQGIARMRKSALCCSVSRPTALRVSPVYVPQLASAGCAGLSRSYSNRASRTPQCAQRVRRGDAGPSTASCRPRSMWTVPMTDSCAHRVAQLYPVCGNASRWRLAPVRHRSECVLSAAVRRRIGSCIHTLCAIKIMLHSAWQMWRAKLSVVCCMLHSECCAGWNA